MKNALFHRYAFLFWSIITFQQAVLSQCPSPAECMEGIYEIENSAAPLHDKIKQLHSWQHRSLKCKIKKDSIDARILHRLGDYYFKLNEFEKGINYAKEAVTINNANNAGALKSYLANTYFNIGLYYRVLNLFAQAQTYFDSSIYIGMMYKDKQRIALLAYQQMAYIFATTGDYQKSKSIARKGVFLSKKLNDKVSEAILLSQEAQAQIDMDYKPEADQNIQLAIKILTENNSPEEYLAVSYSIYASVLSKKRDFKQAVYYYKKAIQINTQKNDWLQCSRDMLNLGSIYDNDLNDPVKALQCFQKGINFLKNSKDEYQLAGLYNNIGYMYSRNKEYKKALPYYQRALNVLPISFRDTVLQENPSADMLKLVTNDYFVSEILFNKGESLLQLFKKEKNNSLLAYALKAFMAADRSIDQMRCNQYNEVSKLFWRENTKKMYENAIEVCYLLNDIDHAFYFFEKSRAVLLNDKLGELGAKRFLPDTDLLKEQKLRNNMSLLQKQLSGIQEGSSSYNETQHQLLIAREEWERFIKGIETNYPAYYQYKYESKVFPKDHVQAELVQHQQSLIEYFTGDSALYILSLSGNKNKLIKVPVQEYNANAQELLMLCSKGTLPNQDYLRYCTLAFQLYSVLFQPLDIPKGRVIISPDENFIPFEALLSSKNESSSFLVKDYAFSYTYSAGFLLRKIVSHTPAENMFLGIAPVAYKTYLNQLPLEGAGQSLQQIKNHFKSATFLINDNATKQQFLASLPLYRIVQLYSHASADSISEEPVLYLCDSVLNLSEIQNLNNVNTDLIVLSACNTGVGKNARGEGIFSLARAFAAAGIPSTVTTLWKIDNQTTYQLTELFYKYLSKGLPKDEALQKAKLEFLATKGAGYRLPYFWAANILLGKTDQFSIEKEVSKYNRYVFAFAFFILVLFLLKKYLRL
jgi:CHAT domain-containing protein